MPKPWIDLSKWQYPIWARAEIKKQLELNGMNLDLVKEFDEEKIKPLDFVADIYQDPLIISMCIAQLGRTVKSFDEIIRLPLALELEFKH